MPLHNPLLSCHSNSDWIQNDSLGSLFLLPLFFLTTHTHNSQNFLLLKKNNKGDQRWGGMASVFKEQGGIYLRNLRKKKSLEFLSLNKRQPTIKVCRTRPEHGQGRWGMTAHLYNRRNCWQQMKWAWAKFKKRLQPQSFSCNVSKACGDILGNVFWTQLIYESSRADQQVFGRKIL